MMIVIIPARGGSKGLPGKNIKLLNGKPLIAHTIEYALKSKCIDRVIVTTDSKEIANVAIGFGAEVPFIRPAELATDTALAPDVYMHCIDFLQRKEDIQIEKFMVLLPTSPLRTSIDIDSAYEHFKEKNATTLVSVCEAEIPPSWYFSMDKDEKLANSCLEFNQVKLANRQNNNKYYVPNGAIYILDKNLLIKERTYYCENTIGFLMDREKSVDIDTALDFRLAELLLK